VSRPQWEAWARRTGVERDLTRIQRHLLIVLASYANADGECFPLLDTLAVDIRRKRRETTRALTDLQRLGLIERRGRGPGKSRLTRLLDSRPTATHGETPDSRPTTSQPLTRDTPRLSLTRGQPHPRLAAHRDQNPHKNPTTPPTPQSLVNATREPGSAAEGRGGGDHS
jgi:hypothetical protein